MNDKQPNIIKIFWNDYWAFISAVFCIVAIGFYFYDIFVATNSSGFMWVAIGMFLLGLFGFIVRYISIVSLYNSGIEAKAVISEVGFFRDRGYIKYIYSFENKKYASQLSVMKNKTTASYQIGEEIEVIVDRENPKKSLIKRLIV
jgi:hypothetical protein